MSISGPKASSLCWTNRISIIDVEKFQEEIDNTKDPKSKELKRTNRLKHKIKVELDNKSGFLQALGGKT